MISGALKIKNPLYLPPENSLNCLKRYIYHDLGREDPPLQGWDESPHSSLKILTHN